MAVVLAAALTLSVPCAAYQHDMIEAPPVVLTAEDQVRVIAEYFWPDWAVERMARIAKCESNFLPTAVNPSSGAAGIWQIMPGWKKTWPGNYLDAWTNGAVAYQIWLVQGFGAWVCK